MSKFFSTTAIAASLLLGVVTLATPASANNQQYSACRAEFIRAAVIKVHAFREDPRNAQKVTKRDPNKIAEKQLKKSESMRAKLANKCGIDPKTKTAENR